VVIVVETETTARETITTETLLVEMLLEKRKEENNLC